VEEEDNPFHLPPDDEIFLMREQERRRRAEEREKFKDLKVHQKTTAASRIHRIKRFKDEDPVSSDKEKGGNAFTGAGAGTIGRDPRREKENIADFVAKKREMFLVQMSLDVKKAEILKLDEKARMKEEALKKSQQMLGEDVERFDRFLQANDAKAHKAMKDAEDKTKEKQQRVQRIKNLKSQISAIQSDISKHKEQKEECIKYKEFLDKLTPHEWKEQQKKIKKSRRKKRQDDWVETKMQENAAKIAEELAAEEEKMEREIEDQEKKRKRGKKKHDAEEEQRERERTLDQNKKKIKRKYPTRDALVQEHTNEHDCSSGEEVPLYFKNPRDLLDIFTGLEEQNLFLIQNSQETEQQLEEIENKLTREKQYQDKKKKALELTINETDKKIKEEEKKAKELQARINSNSGSNGTTDLLNKLTAATKSVFSTCGFDSDHDPGTLQMLAQIEWKLEDLLIHLDELVQTHPDLVKKYEGLRERDRRETVRKLRQEQTAKKNEDRLKQSLLRSQAPVHKKTGKQLMYRSAPLYQEKKEVREDDDEEEQEREHKLFGIYIKNGQPHGTRPERDNQN